MISITVFRVNLHQICHLPTLVRLIGAPFYFRVNTMEEEIGYYKRKVATTTKDVGICMGNILEKKMLFDFLQINNIIDFDQYFTREPNQLSYFSNPLDLDLSELWSPFITRRFQLRKEIPLAMQNETGRYIAGYHSATFIRSLYQYMKKLLGNSAPMGFEDFYLDQRFRLSQRLFYKDHVYVSDSNKSQSRGGTFIKVLSQHKNG